MCRSRRGIGFRVDKLISLKAEARCQHFQYEFAIINQWGSSQCVSHVPLGACESELAQDTPPVRVHMCCARPCVLG